MSGARTVWLQGRFVREDRAQVPATHPLVSHGLGVFETVRITRGEAPWLGRHLERLASACAELGIRPPRVAWADVLGELARRNRMREGAARLTVARGLSLAATRRLPRGLAREKREGVTLETRLLRRDAAHLKSTSWLPLWLAEHGAETEEVLFLGPRGRLLETSRSNVFVLSERGLQTASPPAVLPGIARQVVLERARSLGLRIVARAPSLHQHRQWRSAFVTNAVRGIRPVRAIDAIRLPLPGPDSPVRLLQKELERELGR